MNTFPRNRNTASALSIPIHFRWWALALSVLLFIFNDLAHAQGLGSLDFSFNPGPGATQGAVLCHALQYDNRIIIGGSFRNYYGLPVTMLARVNPDGSADDFTVWLDLLREVDAIALEGYGGAILIAGSFTTVNGSGRPYIARVYYDGSLDSFFSPFINSRVWAAVPQTDGKIVVGGEFTIPTTRVARLNQSDGSADVSFSPGYPYGGPNDRVRSIALQPDGKIVL